MLTVIYILLAIIILLLCFLIFTSGRIVEDIVIIRENSKKLGSINKNLALLTERLGEEDG